MEFRINFYQNNTVIMHERFDQEGCWCRCNKDIDIPSYMLSHMHDFIVSRTVKFETYEAAAEYFDEQFK